MGPREKSQIRNTAYVLVRLEQDRINDIIDLENSSMQTDTTYPLAEDELIALYEKGYVSYGFENRDSRLVSKVGFSRAGDKKFELDVCVHPDFQGRGIGHEIMKQSIDRFISENPDSYIFLTVHPDNPALRLYERVGFQAIRDDDGYYVQSTENGPRLTMEFRGS